MTPIFPRDFITNRECKKTFYIRLLPNLSDFGIGDPIVVSTPHVRDTAFGKKPQHRYYSYALIKEWSDMNRYVKDKVCIFRYGKAIHGPILKFMEEHQFTKDLFNLQCDYSLYLKYEYKRYAGSEYPDYQVYFNPSYDNVIYDENHPGKNDKEKIRELLLNRDLCIEKMTIIDSVDPYKAELEKKYAQILRDEKLSKIIN